MPPEKMVGNHNFALRIKCAHALGVNFRRSFFLQSDNWTSGHRQNLSHKNIGSLSIPSLGVTASSVMIAGGLIAGFQQTLKHPVS